jgi:hypothetical protein
MKVRDVIKRLEQDGWRIARTEGSHRNFIMRLSPVQSRLLAIRQWTFRPERQQYPQAGRA